MAVFTSSKGKKIGLLAVWFSLFLPLSLGQSIAQDNLSEEHLPLQDEKALASVEKPIQPIADIPLPKGLIGNYLSARTARIKNDLETASFYADAALKQSPSDAFLKRQAFLTLLANGQVDEAIALGNELSENGKNLTPLSYLALNINDLKNGKSEQVLERLKKNNKLIDTLSYNFISAWAYAQNGDYQNAIKSMSKLSDYEAYGFETKYQLGLVNLFLKKDKKAEKLFYEAMTTTGDGIYHPTSLLARLALKKGDTTKALSIFNQGLEETTSSFLMSEKEAVKNNISSVKDLMIAGTDITPQKGLAEGLLKIALIFSREQNFELAQIYISLALHLEPNWPLGLFIKGEMLEAMGQNDQALDVYNKLTDDPLYHEQALLKKFYTLTKLKKDDEALALITAYNDKNPNNLDIINEQAEFYFTKEKFDKAIDLYTNVITLESEKNKSKPSNQLWQAYYYRGVAYDRLKKWPEAESDLKKALEFQPFHPLILNYLGYSWVDQGRNLKEALEMLEKAVRGHPGNALIIDSLGWAYYKLGNYSKSITILEQAVQDSPNDPSIQEHLGDVYWKIGRKREAGFQWNHALTYTNDTQEKIRIEKKIMTGAVDEDHHYYVKHLTRSEVTNNGSSDSQKQ